MSSTPRMSAQRVRYQTNCGVGETNPFAIYIRPFCIDSAIFRGDEAASDGEMPMRKALTPVAFAEDLKEELARSRPLESSRTTKGQMLAGWWKANLIWSTGATRPGVSFRHLRRRPVVSRSARESDGRGKAIALSMNSTWRVAATVRADSGQSSPVAWAKPRRSICGTRPSGSSLCSARIPSATARATRSRFVR